MNKTLKPLLTISLVSLTLLSGCTKGEAKIAWRKVQSAVTDQYSVKSWDSCKYIHTDAKKFAKTLTDEEYIKDSLEKGNTVQLLYTFTLKDNSLYYGNALVSIKKEEILANAIFPTLNELDTLVDTFDITFDQIDESYQTNGVLI